jgi:hypothetical protein
VLAKIVSFLAKYRKTLSVKRFRNAAMKTQRDLMQQVDARGVVFGLFAIIVACAAIWLPLSFGSKRFAQASKP